jgi:hypothetical protein
LFFILSEGIDTRIDLINNSRYDWIRTDRVIGNCSKDIRLAEWRI